MQVPLHMSNWDSADEGAGAGAPPGVCSTTADLESATSVCDALRLPLHTVVVCTRLLLLLLTTTYYYDYYYY